MFSLSQSSLGEKLPEAEDELQKFQHWALLCQHFPPQIFFKNTRKKDRETTEEDNCHLVPREVLQSYPCHRQEVAHEVGYTERYQGFPEGNLRPQDTGSLRGPGPPSLYLQVQ